MKQFEIDKTYRASNGLRIKIIKRTDKTLFFTYLDPNWCDDMKKNIQQKN